MCTQCAQSHQGEAANSHPASSPDLCVQLPEVMPERQVALKRPSVSAPQPTLGGGKRKRCILQLVTAPKPSLLSKNKRGGGGLSAAAELSLENPFKNYYKIRRRRQKQVFKSLIMNKMFMPKNCSASQKWRLTLLTPAPGKLRQEDYATSPRLSPKLG